MTQWFISHSPVRMNEHKIYFKSIKTTKGIGGMIVANGYGKTKDEAELIAKKIAAIPSIKEALGKLKLLNDITVDRIIDAIDKAVYE